MKRLKEIVVALLSLLVIVPPCEGGDCQLQALPYFSSMHMHYYY